MKFITIFSICITATVLCFSQTDPSVSVVCDVGDPDCFFTDPLITASYIASTNDRGFTESNGWIKEYAWNPSGGFSDKTESGNSLSLRWNNTSNSTTKRVKVTVTYKKTGQTDKVVTGERVVVVKHIAPIASMTVDGSTYNTSGSTAAVSCGTSSFTVSVPAPTTDPVATVVYDWDLPSGWSGSSTSRTITVTPNAGGDGSIDVSARRSDGTVEQQFFVNISRPTVGNPSISGSFPRIVCNGDTESFSVNDVSTLARGIYYLVITLNNGDSFQEVIRLNKCKTPSTIYPYVSIQI